MQEHRYNEDGWKEDPLGIEQKMDELEYFTKHYRQLRDAEPTEEERAKGRLAAIKTIQKSGIELNSEERKDLKRLSYLDKKILKKPTQGVQTKSVSVAMPYDQM